MKNLSRAARIGKANRKDLFDFVSDYFRLLCNENSINFNI